MGQMNSAATSMGLYQHVPRARNLRPALRVRRQLQRIDALFNDELFLQEQRTDLAGHAAELNLDFLGRAR